MQSCINSVTDEIMKKKKKRRVRCVSFFIVGLWRWAVGTKGRARV